MRAGFLPTETPFGIAHRGGLGGGPENSLAAFTHAVDLGYTHLETDVHLTADGVVVAFHDPDLERMLGRPGRIADLTWAEISELRLDGDHRIPRFEDLLRLLPSACFNVDPKADEAVEPLCDLVGKADAVDRICIGAFSDERIKRAKQLLGPGLCTSPGPKELAQLLLQARLGRRISTDHRCVQIPPRHRGLPLDRDWLISRLHESGLQVHFWTINERAEMERLLDAGADAVISDETALLRAVLDERDLGDSDS